ncbi:DUF952 domain-containing protein [Gloeobacter violaceus]|uniref:Gll2762 protein n=1 Tax=Gloeobacter violaceus (strain ATCC 29082 / PCC 7421) TaxID=251221 RepID=Q7NGX5_GLOVI|nr:DUF952 domain-containing protein [Gloeobacter violaceus]BAC90703.1 gll2762 [Gloeobacter violaceus PCC 7421]
MQPEQPIFHITSRSQWEAARGEGVYRPPSLQSEGFIHCCRAEQLAGVRERYFRGQTALMLLTIDPSKLTAAVREEDAHGRGETFPHLYGPLNLNAVVEVCDLPAADT